MACMCAVDEESPYGGHCSVDEAWANSVAEGEVSTL